MVDDKELKKKEKLQEKEKEKEKEREKKEQKEREKKENEMRKKFKVLIFFYMSELVCSHFAPMIQHNYCLLNSQNPFHITITSHSASKSKGALTITKTQ